MKTRSDVFFVLFCFVKKIEQFTKIIQHQCSLCTLYLLACQVRVTVGDSGLCYCVCVTAFEC